MLISKYLARKKTSIQRIAELLIFMTWTVLCLFGIVGATNHLKSEQNLFELFLLQFRILEIKSIMAFL